MKVSSIGDNVNRENKKKNTFLNVSFFLVLKLEFAVVLASMSFQTSSLKITDTVMTMGLNALPGMLINHGAKVLTMNGVSLLLIGAM